MSAHECASTGATRFLFDEIVSSIASAFKELIILFSSLIMVLDFTTTRGYLISRLSVPLETTISNPISIIHFRPSLFQQQSFG